MIVLVAGADRDRLVLQLVSDGIITETVDERPVQTRNDAEQLAAFLTSHQPDIAVIGAYVLLEPPRSLTTVRVLRTLLSVRAWYANRPLVVVPVQMLSEIHSDKITHALTTASDRFDPSVLEEAA